MGRINSFKEILAWQRAHKLTLEVYKIVKDFPRFEEFGLADQMRRCSVSISSNIAEGFKRRSNKDSYHFYNISEGSLEELKYQILLAKDLGYISDEDFDRLSVLADEVGKTLFGWIKSQN